MKKGKKLKKGKKPKKTANAKTSKQANKPGKSNKYDSFFDVIRQDSELKALRQEYADAAPDDRRKAAEWEYDSEMASFLFDEALRMMGSEPFACPAWPSGFVALAIDPLYAPALLTVGTVEYQSGFVKEAMELFLTLTTLPEDEEDLAVIIDKAGDFLLDEGDVENALELYLSAQRAYPSESLYYSAAGYCYGKLGKMVEAVRDSRKAVELDPDNHLHLNDLGYSLLEAGLFEEAETVLNEAIDLAPLDYELAQNNLDELYERMAKA